MYLLYVGIFDKECFLYYCAFISYKLILNNNKNCFISIYKYMTDNISWWYSSQNVPSSLWKYWCNKSILPKYQKKKNRIRCIWCLKIYIYSQRWHTPLIHKQFQNLPYFEKVSFYRTHATHTGTGTDSNNAPHTTFPNNWVWYVCRIFAQSCAILCTAFLFGMRQYV